MILQALVSVLDKALAAMAGTLPGPPGWLDGFGLNAAGTIQGLLDAIAKWGFIVPFETIGAVFPIGIGAAGLAIVIKIVRIIASYLTLGGGM